MDYHDNLNSNEVIRIKSAETLSSSITWGPFLAQNNDDKNHEGTINIILIYFLFGTTTNSILYITST
jgi:hypothetical protein